MKPFIIALVAVTLAEVYMLWLVLSMHFKLYTIRGVCKECRRNRWVYGHHPNCPIGRLGL